MCSQVLAVLLLVMFSTQVYGGEKYRQILSGRTIVLNFAEAPGTGDLFVAGATADAEQETAGEKFQAGPSGFVQFIARFTPNGDLLYFRYLPGVGDGTFLHVDHSGSIWLQTSPAGTDISPTYDLSDLIIQNPVSYLLRLDQEDGRVISSTKLQGKWTSIAVDSKGAVWLGGVARGRLTTTPDAFEPRNSRADGNRCCAGALIRLSNDAARVTYSTYLGEYSDGVETLTLDSADNLYAAGTRIWKFSPDGQLIWSTRIAPSLARASTVALNGDFFLAGCTTALTPVFYTTPGAYQNLPGNTVPFVDRFGDPDYPAACQDGFVTRFDPDGNILYSTLIGGPGSDAVRLIQTDSAGRAFVALDMDPQPPQTRNIVLAGSRGYGMARLSPDGSRVDFLTQYDLSFAFAPPPLIPTGLTEVIRRIALRGRKGGGSDILLFEDTLPDDRLPRIDAITIRSDTQAVDYELEIRGEGFDVGGEFLLDGVAIPVVFVSDSVIRTGTFRTRVPLENLFSPNQIRATYKLTIRNRDGGARSVTVLLRPPADAPPEEIPLARSSWIRRSIYR